MRSAIVKTFEKGQNRFELCHQTFKAVRKLHAPGGRIQDTANDAIKIIADVVAAEPAVVEDEPTREG